MALPQGELTPAQRELHSRFTSGPRADPRAAFRLVDDEGTLFGPPGIWLHSPAIGGALEQLGGTTRFGLELGDAAREALILAVGASERSEFELTAHRRAAGAAGIGDEDVEAIIAGSDPETLDDEAAAVLRLTRAILLDDDLDDDRFAEARALIGDSRLVEVLTLIGYYRTVALQLRVYRIGADGR